MWNFFHFLWKAGLGYEAQAGSVFSGNIKFPESHTLDREKVNSAEGNSFDQAVNQALHLNTRQYNPVRRIICEVEHSEEHIIKIVLGWNVLAPIDFRQYSALSRLWSQ